MKIQIKGACYKLPKRFFSFLRSDHRFLLFCKVRHENFPTFLRVTRLNISRKAELILSNSQENLSFRNRYKIPNFILKNTAKQEVPWERTIVWMIKLTRFHLKWTQNYTPHLRIKWLCCLRLIRCINKIES